MRNPGSCRRSVVVAAGRRNHLAAGRLLLRIRTSAGWHCGSRCDAAVARYSASIPNSARTTFTSIAENSAKPSQAIAASRVKILLLIRSCGDDVLIRVKTCKAATYQADRRKCSNEPEGG